jgi:hypothetical protein
MNKSYSDERTGWEEAKFYACNRFLHYNRRPCSLYKPIKKTDNHTAWLHAFWSIFHYPICRIRFSLFSYNCNPCTQRAIDKNSMKNLFVISTVSTYGRTTSSISPFGWQMIFWTSSYVLSDKSVPFHSRIWSPVSQLLLVLLLSESLLLKWCEQKKMSKQ